MDETMFDSRTVHPKMSDTKLKDDYSPRSLELDQKFSLPWSPQKENKFLFKHHYMSSSRSVPQRRKRFIQCRISRSLNFDVNLRNSSSDNMSCEEDKHLTRSAKIMRALNFPSSACYYGRTKIKRSLNFNLTPSPKRFTKKNRTPRKALSLNLNSSSSGSEKVLNFNESPNNSANSSLVFGSPESMDENQNETPSQHSRKRRELLNYSTPNTKFNRISLNACHLTPLIRDGLENKIENFSSITATPNPQSLKSSKIKLKFGDSIVMSTPRNLFQDFLEEDDNRPCTPENLIYLLPESMSAIKMSHKKERLSRRSERSAQKLLNTSISDKSLPLNGAEEVSTPQTNHKYTSFRLSSKKRKSNNARNWTELSAYNSEDDDLSDTGSIFNYAEEKQNTSKETNQMLDEASGYDDSSDFLGFNKCEINADKQENEGEWKWYERKENLLKVDTKQEVPKNSKEINQNESSISNNDAKSDDRSVTPEPSHVPTESSQTVVTPENRIHFLQQVLKDSIKKSHKKSKDDNKKKFFSPKVLDRKYETPKHQDNVFYSQDQKEHAAEENVPEKDIPVAIVVDRAITPEKLSSSRLLLSQFSSVKKSHKKDKHAKILSGFLRRKEYFNRDSNLLKNTENKVSDLYASGRKSSMEDLSASFISTTTQAQNKHDESTTYSKEALAANGNAYVDKLSPSKRKKSLDILPESNKTNVCNDSEIQNSNSSVEDFRIFTPLKRRRSLPTTNAKEYLCFYRLPCGKDEISEAGIMHIELSRCVTPIASYRENFVTSHENESQDCSISVGNAVNGDGCSAEASLSGRSTPRNMSTTELYSNIDSIKKSHKKNKRGHGLDKRGVQNLERTSFNTNELEENHKHSSKELKPDPNESLRNDSDRSHNTAEANNADDSLNREEHELLLGNEEAAPLDVVPSTSTETTTPPNCLKVKNYIRLLQQTSIKHSHKKVRDRRRHESMASNTHELSDDGSIFGEEDLLDQSENQSIPDDK